MASNKKVAFLANLYDDFHFPKAWATFFADSKAGWHSLYVHQKDKANLIPPFADALVPTVATDHGGLLLWQSYVSMLEHALKDPLNDRFVFLSQACLPLSSMREVRNRAFATDKSQMVICDDAQCLPRLQFLVDNGFPKDCLKKHSAWMILNLQHAELFVENKVGILALFKGGPEKWFPDEHIFGSYLWFLGRGSEIMPVRNIPEEMLTFTYWEGMPYAFNDPYFKGLKHYHNVQELELVYLFEQSCLFGRKFKKECMVHGGLGHVLPLESWWLAYWNMHRDAS